MQPPIDEPPLPDSGRSEPPDRPPDVQSSLGVSPGGSLRWSVQSRPPQNETGAAYVAKALVWFLNRRGQGWSEPVPPDGLEPGVDQLARGPLGALRVQVTRVPTEQPYYQDLGRQGHTSKESSVSDLANDLMAAIRHKAEPGQEALNAGITLMLDAQFSLPHGLLPVLDEFDTNYQKEAAAAGFHEIWLVTAMHIHRLIPGEWVDSPDVHVA